MNIPVLYYPTVNINRSVQKLRVMEKECGRRVTQKLDCGQSNLIISEGNGLDALWGQCHQIRHIYFFASCYLHFQTSFSFLLYVPCRSLPGLQKMDYMDLKPLCEACPFWLWVTNNAEFTWGTYFHNSFPGRQFQPELSMEYLPFLKTRT